MSRDPIHISEIIRSTAARSAEEDSDLMASFFARCWPGDGADRTQAGAREWVRRWAPKRLTVGPAPCACAEGRCAWCN